MSGVNEDFNNRQLQETEKQLAKFLADRSGGRFTAKQIEDQLRAASRAMPGKQVENPGDGIVLTGVGSGQNAPVYTTRIVDGTGWVNNGTVVYQPVPAADREIISYIRSSLGVNSPYSWSLPSDSKLQIKTSPFTIVANRCATANCAAGLPSGRAVDSKSINIKIQGGAHVPLSPGFAIGPNVSYTAGGESLTVAPDVGIGTITDVGVSVGVYGPEKYANPVTINFGLGRYGGLQITPSNQSAWQDYQWYDFGRYLNGVSIGVGLGVSAPISLTVDPTYQGGRSE